MITWVTQQWYKMVWSTGSVKRQKEGERKSISDQYPTIVQQQVNTLAEALDNGYASWSCWKIIGRWSKMLFLSLLLCLLTDRCSEPFCKYHCRMDHDDGGLWCNVFRKICISEPDIYGNRTNDSIESFARLWSNSQRRMNSSKLSQLFYIIVFGHEMYRVSWLQFVLDNKKRHTIKINNSLSNDISIMFQP